MPKLRLGDWVSCSAYIRPSGNHFEIDNEDTGTALLWRKDATEGEEIEDYESCEKFVTKTALFTGVVVGVTWLCTELFCEWNDPPYPDIGAPNWEIIVAAAAEQIAGAGLILWTCREGELLENALEACARWGLHFDAVNDSLPSWKKFYGNETRKVGATEYWDDKAYRVQNGKLMKEAAHEMD